MNNKLIPKNNIFKEVFSKGYFNRAHTRVRRRKSAWNLILVPFALAEVGAVFYGLFRLSWQIHILIYTEHIGRFNEFWEQGISIRAFISSFMLGVPLFFGAATLKNLK